MASPLPDLPSGVFPVMLTAFHENGRIDFDGVDRLTDWYLARGAAGLFVGAMSGEAHWLDNDEKVALARRVVRRADGRAPVVAGALGEGTPGERVELIRRLRETGAQAVVVTTPEIAPHDADEDAWLDNAGRLLDALPDDLALGLYECPKPYSRPLSPRMARWAARTDRFVYLKETSGSLDHLREKLKALRGSPLRLYNACTHTLLASLEAGARGYSGLAANFCPELIVWLCAQWRDDPDRAQAIQKVLDDADPTITSGYPASAKVFLRLLGVPIGPFCRAPHDPLGPTEQQSLEHLRDRLGEWGALATQSTKDTKKA